MKRTKRQREHRAMMLRLMGHHVPPPQYATPVIVPEVDVIPETHVSLKEAAVAVGRTASHLRLLARQGCYRAVRVGNRIFVHIEEVTADVQQKELKKRESS